MGLIDRPLVLLVEAIEINLHTAFMEDPRDKPKEPGLRRELYTVIFEAETRGGKAFDLALLFVILISIVVICLESVVEIEKDYGWVLRTIEWIITILFTAEYLLRIYCTDRPFAYLRSFFGLIDLLSILPSYFGLFLSGTHSLGVIRGLRLLRVFRILKMGQFLGAANVLTGALKASGPKITIFIGTVITLVIIIGSLMFLIEGPENGFTSIPISMYWAIVTLTTVGYGDIAPQTIWGQLLAAGVMVTGYGIIAVPTGIVTSEMTRAQLLQASRQANPPGDGSPARTCCELSMKEQVANFCKTCGRSLR